MKENPDALALRYITGVLRRRWKMIASIALVGAGVAGGIGLLVPPRYTAKAQIVVEMPVSNIVGTLDEAAIETRVELLLSASHLKRVLAALEKDGRSLVRDQAPRFSLWPRDDSAENTASAIQILQGNVNAFKERRSRVIGVTYTATDPTLAADVANTSVKVYFETLARNRQIEREEKLNALEAQLPRARAEAERTDAALQAYRSEAGLVEGKRADLAQEEMADLTRQLSLARSELGQRQEKMKLLRGFILTGAGARDVSEALQDPTFAEAVREMSTDARAASDQNRRDPGSKLGMAVQQHLSKVTDEAERFSARVRALQQRLETFRHASGEVRRAEIRLRELERESSAATQFLQSLLQQHVELRSSSPEPLDVRVASPASPPEFPSSPNPILFIPPAMTVALVFAGLMAVLLERLDDTVRSQRDFTESLGAPCAGLVPKGKRRMIRHAHRDLQKNPFSPYAEAIRTVALSILTPADSAGRPRLVAVTSSAQGEGKTTLVTSLASYLTLIGKRVLVVDLDFRNPGFGAARSGLLDVFHGRPLSEVVRQIEGTRVDYVPMQDFRGDPLSALKVEHLGDQIRTACGDSYDYVIIDTGPLLGAAETPAICNAADIVLFAVSWGTTRSDVARNALQLVPRSKVLGVLTKVDLRQHARFRFGDVGEALSKIRTQAAQPKAG